jgi:hypothetical protein
MHILDIVIERGLVTDVFQAHLSGPVCKDFLKGECKRGGKCKFRHMTRADVRDAFGVKPNKRPCPPVRGGGGGGGDYDDDVGGNNDDGGPWMNGKRRAYDGGGGRVVCVGPRGHRSPPLDADAPCSNMRPYRCANHRLWTLI